MGRSPLDQIDRLAKGDRKRELGVMGFADLFIRLGVPYDSEEALLTGDEIMRFIRERGWPASEDLARARGVFNKVKAVLFKNLRDRVLSVLYVLFALYAYGRFPIAWIVLLPLVENTVMAATLCKARLQEHRLDQGGKKPCLPRTYDLIFLSLIALLAVKLPQYYRPDRVVQYKKGERYVQQYPHDPAVLERPDRAPAPVPEKGRTGEHHGNAGGDVPQGGR
jgi:ribonucleotide reductase alpha subunit